MMDQKNLTFFNRMLEEHFEEQMKEIIKECQMGRQTMLFSATMTDKVSQICSEHFSFTSNLNLCFISLVVCIELFYAMLNYC